MSDKYPANPLSITSAIKKVETYNVNEILARYEVLGIDVSRYFKNIKTIDLFECSNTGYRFYYPFSINGDAKFYEDLSLNRKNYYSDRWEHMKSLDYLKNTDNVLEVGSGFGAFLSLLKLHNIKALGLELNPIAVKKCNEDGLNVSEKLIQQEAKENKNSYSAVCYFQVLEHITEVYGFIYASLEILEDKGKLIIGVPNNNPYLFVNDRYHTLNLPPHHAGLWNKKSLKSLEKIFSIKLESVVYEPLENTYSEFLKSYIKNSNIFYAKVLKFFKKVLPILQKKVLCKFIRGRNILVVFRKII